MPLDLLLSNAGFHAIKLRCLSPECQEHESVKVCQYYFACSAACLFLLASLNA